KLVETALQAVPGDDGKIKAAVKEASVQLDEYRNALARLIDNAKELDELSIEMTDSAVAIIKASSAMKADLLADQQLLDTQSSALIGEAQSLVVLLAIGGFLLG